jgi:ribosome-associated protein
MLVINAQLSIPDHELVLTYTRSGGPGGQNVNKVNTRATLRWSVRSSPSLPEDVKSRFVQRYARRITAQGDLLVSSQRFRDQSRNAQDCRNRLKEMLLDVSTPPKVRRATRSTRAARERRLRDKHQRSTSKQLRRRPSPDV